MKAIGAWSTLPVDHEECLVEFELDKPVAGAGEVLVRVAAAGVNPVDTKVRLGIGREKLPSPRILGWDAAGVIEAVGEGVAGFSVGDEVFYAGAISRPGSNAEFQVVDANLIAKKPATWNFAEAAAIPLVGITAWELLFERMGITPADQGKTLLIINGAGGVGSAMIPLAIHAGLRVMATASRAETIAWCKQLGADETINHREPLRPQLEALGISAVPFIANLFHTDQYWEQTADLLAPQGALGLIVEPDGPLALGDPLKAKSAKIAWEFMFTRSSFQTSDRSRQGEILAELAGFCDAGILPKLVTRTLHGMTAENFRLAHEVLENGMAIGKWTIEY